MKLLTEYQVLAAFQQRSHRNMGQLSMPELPLWQRYAKTTQLSPNVRMNYIQHYKAYMSERKPA